MSHELTETAPLIRTALTRLHGKPVLLMSVDAAPITSGRLSVVEGLDGPLLPSLVLEFMLRGITFTMEVPLARVFDLVATWNGANFVFQMPPDQRLAVEWPIAGRLEATPPAPTPVPSNPTVSAL